MKVTLKSVDSNFVNSEYQVLDQDGKVLGRIWKRNKTYWTSSNGGSFCRTRKEAIEQVTRRWISAD